MKGVATNVVIVTVEAICATLATSVRCEVRSVPTKGKCSAGNSWDNSTKGGNEVDKVAVDCMVNLISRRGRAMLEHEAEMS